MRVAAVLLPIALLFGAACAPRPAEVATAASDPPALDASGLEASPAVGTWAFSMDNPMGGAALAGTLVIAPDGTGRIAVPSQGIDSAVQRGALEARGSAFVWRGEIGSPMGPLAFVMRGEVEGDRLTGRNELAGLGSFRLEAERRP